MKKITPLIFALFLSMQIINSQNISQSNSLTVDAIGTPFCNTGNITKTNAYYRSFDLNDFSITSSYDITSVEFGIETMSGAPLGGYPIKVSIYTTDAAFPSGTLTLINEVTEMITDQDLTLYSSAIIANIPANEEFVVGISIISDAIADGGNGLVTFIMGANDLGETAAGYIEANACGFSAPVLFSNIGIARPDVHLVMNVVGTSATASVGDLELVDFSYYPNPVKDKLIMKSKEQITSVSLYNVLGEQIKKIEPSQLDAELDVASLARGTYFVRATVNDKVGSFKIVKN